MMQPARIFLHSGGLLQSLSFLDADGYGCELSLVSLRDADSASYYKAGLRLSQLPISE